MRTARLLPLLLASALLAVTALPQTPAPNPAPLPKDPSALMLLAWQQNGLHGPDPQPWHISASFQVLDPKGQVKDQGTFEEWWAGAKKRRIAFTSSKFHQTRYIGANGDFQAGNDGQPPALLDLIDEAIRAPLPDPAAVATMKLDRTDRKDSGISLACVVRTPETPGAPVSFPGGRVPFMLEYCFGAPLPLVRMEETPAMQIVFNSIKLFQQRYLAGDIQIREAGQETRIHLDSIGTLDSADDALLAPPANAVPAPPLVDELQAAIGGHRTAGAAPQYPAIAKATHMTGAVVIQGIIQPDGSLADLTVVSGPPMLQSAAMDAVRTWRYQPFLIDGKPAAACTEVVVQYGLYGVER